mmetsp:Transcript_17093/g.23923  ORF Transcript_17093/g.23923 Transcript_17093/m.23923 type:complete len:84 (-) Transcript_17093:735-986(-)
MTNEASNLEWHLVLCTTIVPLESICCRVHSRACDVTTKKISSHPIATDGHSIPSGEQHGEIHGTPDHKTGLANNARLPYSRMY